MQIGKTPVVVRGCTSREGHVQTYPLATFRERLKKQMSPRILSCQCKNFSLEHIYPDVLLYFSHQEPNLLAEFFCFLDH
jgi:hypothetical protein